MMYRMPLGAPSRAVSGTLALTVLVAAVRKRSRTSSIPALEAKKAVCSSRKFALMLVSVACLSGRGQKSLGYPHNHALNDDPLTPRFSYYVPPTFATQHPTDEYRRNDCFVQSGVKPHAR